MKLEIDTRVIYHSDPDDDEDEQIQQAQMTSEEMEEEARQEILDRPIHLSTCAFNEW